VKVGDKDPAVTARPGSETGGDRVAPARKGADRAAANGVAESSNLQLLAHSFAHGNS
jgi:hypothetical protein